MGVAPGGILTFVIILIGGLSSVATDAGYLILIPLAAAAFLSIKRHPLLGLAAAYAGVSAAFAVNILIAPLDAMLTEMTNEAIAILDPSQSITITANLYFSIASTILMAIVMTIIAEKMTAKQLGEYDPALAIAAAGADDADPAIEEKAALSAEAESRGLRWALYALIGMIVGVVALTAPSGAPLRDPINGDIIGNTPFMDSLIFIITLLFLAMGIGFGYGAKTFKSSNDVITGVTKAFAGLSGLIFMLLMISQFIALFNWSNMPNVIAGKLANWLGDAGFSEIPLLVGFISDHLPARHHHAGLDAEVGYFCADLRAALHAARGGSANRAGRVPRRRLAHERHHAAHGLSPVHPGRCAALREKHRHRHHHLADDSLHPRGAHRRGSSSSLPGT